MASINIQAALSSILQRLRQVEESQSRSNAVIGKLRLEIDDALTRIQYLEFSHESSLRDTNSFLQTFGEQVTMSRRREQEKLRAAFARLREEIDEERSTCLLLKQQNKKLMMELEEANIVAADAGEELDRERKARELMEEVCNELAREIGEDKAEVEHLKQEQEKSRELVERELKMMRMAALWQVQRDDREALERDLTMHQLASEGALQADIDHEEEKIFAPISSHACYSNMVSSVASNADSQECEEQSMCQIDHVELQIKPRNCNKRSLNNVRRPHITSATDHGYPVGVIQARKPLKLHYKDYNDDDDDDAIQQVVSGKNSHGTDRIFTLHHVPLKDFCESKDPWNVSGRRAPLTPTSCDGSEPCTQKHSLPCTRMVKRVHQRQSSLHLDENCEEDHTVHGDEHLPSHLKVHCLSEDDTGYGNAICQRQLSGRGHLTSLAAKDCVCKTKQDDEDTNTYIHGVQEGERNADGYHSTHVQEYGCEDGFAVGVEGEEQGDAMFYYEPVKNGGSTPQNVHRSHCEVGYAMSNANDHDVGTVGVEERLHGFCDKPVESNSNVNGTTTIYDAMVNGNEGNCSSTMSASYGGGMPGNSSSKEATAPPIRIKSTRSASPIKQCFRPPPTSPSHDDAIPSAPNFHKGHGNSMSYSIKTGQLGAAPGHGQMDMDGQTMEAQFASVDGVKTNSLRAELLKARELDLEQNHHHHHLQIKTPPPFKSSNSSFKFSPLRRALTHSHSR